MAHLTLGQIKQLIEIDEANKEDDVAGMLQMLISRLTSGGVDAKAQGGTRRVQAKRLYNKGFGWGQSFEEYLEDIPGLTDELENEDRRFPHLVLVDTRLPIRAICRLLDVTPHTRGRVAEAFGKEPAQPVYWMRAQTGHRQRACKTVSFYRAYFDADEIGLTFHEALACFAQSWAFLKGCAIDTPGTVEGGYRSLAGYLSWLKDHPRPQLGFRPQTEEASLHSTASRRK